MKILVIAPTPFFIDRGCHKRIYEEARVLKERGHEVTICTYHLGRDISDIKVVRSIKIPWYKKLEAGPSWHKLYIDWLLLITIIREIKKDRPDIIHAHLHEGAFLGLIIRCLFKLPMIADFQGSLVGELLDHRFIRQNRFFYKIFKLIEHKIHKFAKSMITSSRQAADLIKKSYVFDYDRMIPVEDGVNLAKFNLRTPDISLRKELKISEKKKIIMYVGILNDYQGIDYLLEAISYVISGRNDLHFVIVGFPEQGYKEKASTMEILSSTTFTGRIHYEDIPRYLSIADAGISAKTSETEANGKLLEYMAMGIPSIVFDNHINKEILGDLGFYAKMRDSRSLADTINEALESIENNNDLKNKLRKRAEEKFSWESKVDIIQSLYNKKIAITELNKSLHYHKT
ncbi:glycosyltransferase family 4 protein [Chlamydiota bacterium]